MERRRHFSVTHSRHLPTHMTTLSITYSLTHPITHFIATQPSCKLFTWHYICPPDQCSQFTRHYTFLKKTITSVRRLLSEFINDWLSHWIRDCELGATESLVVDKLHLTSSSCRKYEFTLIGRVFVHRFVYEQLVGYIWILFWTFFRSYLRSSNICFWSISLFCNGF